MQNVRPDNHLASSLNKHYRCISTHNELARELAMKLYCGIDLHSNNSVIVILDGLIGPKQAGLVIVAATRLIASPELGSVSVVESKQSPEDKT
jgi:hypothetical protein